MLPFLFSSSLYSLGELLSRGAEKDGVSGPSGRHQPAPSDLLPPTLGDLVQGRTQDNPKRQNVGFDRSPPPFFLRSYKVSCNKNTTGDKKISFQPSYRAVTH